MSLRIFQKGFNFSQDGPGNRLVYHLQGCNLRCPWCSNPEGLALTGGREYSVEELVAEVCRSEMMFFDGGGITLTGGEVALQLDEVRNFLSKLKEKGIHTCIETNGTSPRLPELFPVLDMLIMDIKHYDEDKHREVTGLSCRNTVENISAALNAGMPLALRIPLIGGFNSEIEDAHGFCRLFSQLNVAGRATVELLPYHEYGKDKYAALNLPYTMTETAKISKERLAAFKRVLTDSNIHIIHT